MLTSLLRLFKKVDVLPKEETIYVKEKQKFNVKKAFGTFRLKNGENIISMPVYGFVSDFEYRHQIITGKEAFEQWIFSINSLRNGDFFLKIKEDRYVRVSDIMDIINVVESDHEIEAEISVKKILRLIE